MLMFAKEIFEFIVTFTTRMVMEGLAFLASCYITLRNSFLPRVQWKCICRLIGIQKDVYDTTFHSCLHVAK